MSVCQSLRGQLANKGDDVDDDDSKNDKMDNLLNVKYISPLIVEIRLFSLKLFCDSILFMRPAHYKCS